MSEERQRELAAAIAAAFQPGMADAVRIAEAEERARLQARTLGIDGQMVIDRARHRYIASPLGGTDVYAVMLGDVIAEEMRGVR